MNYINAICRTNLDDYNCNMVTKFVALPRIGEKVVVKKNGHVTFLKICQITHDETNGEPFIIVELHKV
jgi:hypothetical protein